MWHRFTAEARVSIVYAQQEATQADVKPEHLFLEYPHLQKMFGSCDISPESLREKIAHTTSLHKNLTIREKIADLRWFLSQWIR